MEKNIKSMTPSVIHNRRKAYGITLQAGQFRSFCKLFVTYHPLTEISINSSQES